MRRLIALLLIVFTLLANAAWAFDTYSVSAFDFSTQSPDNTDHHDDCVTGVHCHHCHGSAHLLTVPADGIVFAVNRTSHLIAAGDTRMPFFIPSLPYQPPRI
ncbi:MAG TPA: hypothetical protein VIR60_01260 [Gammaproteobacteria bacterium]